MAESNISRDHIAMEAMKVLMQKNVSEYMTFKNKIKKLFGLEYKSVIAYDEEWLAKMAYDFADVMIAQREKIMEDKL
jgi:hypothetical protein